MKQFKVGDKVQSTQVWASEYKYAIVTEARDGEVWGDWYENNGEVHTDIMFHASSLYLLEAKTKKKGLCKFLGKIHQEYSK
jgi:hypothetical protein